MGALAPVFTPTTAGERRSVTVFFEPIPGHKAERIVGNESMSSELAAEVRRRSGFKLRATHRRDAARVDDQDQRLADGNALVRVGIAAAVTVPNTWSITDYGRRLESNITGCGFNPLRPRPGPGLRIRRRLHPTRDRSAQEAGSPLMASRTKGRDGRGVAQLVADFGHNLPPLAATPEQVKDRDPFTIMVGKHGQRGRAAGWCPVPAPLAVYRMTSEQVGGVWPLIAGDGLPSTGAQMGIDYLSGGAFHADPIGWTLAGVVGVTNPNMMFFGAPGRGKSGTVKMFCLRMMAYAYRTLILGDVKDEYEPLCRALGVEPHAVGHGLPARINPLDFGPLGNDWTHLPHTEAQHRAAMVFSPLAAADQGTRRFAARGVRPDCRDRRWASDP